MNRGLIVLFLFISACAQYTWVHPDFNETSWQRDTYECERDMLQAHPPMHRGERTLVEGVVASQFYSRCLTLRGYNRVKVK
jgi:hypothetical protein